MSKIGLGIMVVGVVILITMLLCSCGSNPVAPPIDPPPVEPSIEMPEGAVVAYEDSTYTVLYDAENVYVYFHSESGNGMKLYIRPATASSEDFWDVKTQGLGFVEYGPEDCWYNYSYGNWHESPDPYSYGGTQDVVLVDDYWPNENTYHSLISFPRYTLDINYDYRIYTGWYDISVNTAGSQGEVESPITIHID